MLKYTAIDKCPDCGDELFEYVCIHCDWFLTLGPALESGHQFTLGEDGNYHKERANPEGWTVPIDPSFLHRRR